MESLPFHMFGVLMSTIQIVKHGRLFLLQIHLYCTVEPHFIYSTEEGGWLIPHLTWVTASPFHHLSLYHQQKHMEMVVVE